MQYCLNLRFLIYEWTINYDFHNDLLLLSVLTCGRLRNLQTFAESLSYLAYARPFKNPAYTKNANRRTKNLKTVLTQERERERTERERRRAEREERMDIDAPASATEGAEGEEERKERKESPEEEEDIPSCTFRNKYFG